MTSHRDARQPAVVVGLGPVGATAALLLSAHGVPTVVLERETEPHGEGRAVALDDTALCALEAAGLGRCLPSLFTPARLVRFISRSGRELLALRPGVSAQGHPELSFFHQPDLERALRQALERAPGVEIRSGHELVALRQRTGGVEVTVLERPSGRLARIDAAVVLGCDGARSWVRRAIGARLRGLSSPRRWLVVDTRIEAGAPGCFEFGCDPARPWVHGTLPGGRHRWEFLLEPGETAGELERPDAVRRLLDGHGQAGAEVLRGAVYAHHARVADRLVRGRVLLLGDAAHLSPPFAGQGLSAGLRDAMEAAWRVAGAVEDRSSAAVLAGYGAERRPDILRATALALAVGAVVQTRGRRLAAVRDAVLAAALSRQGVAAWVSEGRWKPSGGVPSALLPDGRCPGCENRPG